MGRTTIAFDLIAAIKLGTARKEEVLRDLADASAGAEQLRHGPPAMTVNFYQLRPPAAPAGIARGTGFATTSTVVEPIYDLAHQAPLYALSDAARVDVVRFGRHPDQDVQVLDILVSREHGLVIYADRCPLYCDYGTLIAGKHAGTTNGTYINGVSRIRDAMIPWLPGHALMLGREFRDRDNNPVFSIKVTYTVHELSAESIHPVGALNN